MPQIEWMDSEWNSEEGAASAYLDGICGEVYPERVYEAGMDAIRWAWDVKPDSTRCEWPELASSGMEDTPEQARTACEVSMLRNDASYPHIAY